MKTLKAQDAQMRANWYQPTMALSHEAACSRVRGRISTTSRRKGHYRDEASEADIKTGLSHFMTEFMGQGRPVPSELLMGLARSVACRGTCQRFLRSLSISILIFIVSHFVPMHIDSLSFPIDIDPRKAQLLGPSKLMSAALPESNVELEQMLVPCQGSTEIAVSLKYQLHP